MNPFAVLRRSLRARIILLVALGMVTLAGILGLSSLWHVRDLAERALQERRRLAQVVADQLDTLLRSNLIVLQEVALAARGGFEVEDPRGFKTTLREAYLRSVFTQGVFLLDRARRLVWIEPQRPPWLPQDLSSLSLIRRTLEEGKPEISNLVVDGKKRIYAVVPIRDWHGELVGAVGGILDPESARFRSLLPPIPFGDTTYLELVDGQGIVLASTKVGRAFTESDHGRFLASLIQERKSVVGTCHSCHEEEGAPDREREVIAFAPMVAAPWGLSIRQAESEALAAALGMQRRLLMVGSLTILVVVLFAWGVARSVTRPLGALAQGAQRIARGNLDEPISMSGEDEIGHLAHAFDRMRVQLKASFEATAAAQQHLEERVKERTRELEVLYHELRQKEEMRGELLKKVITAQEEERKRIARELHDEISQALAALLLTIETSLSTAPEESKERLSRMKATADRILDGIHRLIFDLRPSVLDDLGLTSALRWSAERHLDPLGIDLAFEVFGFERRLEVEIETTLFRIGQEAISNIAKHAEAESVKIAINFREKTVGLEVVDDGKGFFQSEGIARAAKGPRGLGLLGMKERAALLNGTLTVDSEPGKGTRVTVEVPIVES